MSAPFLLKSAFKVDKLVLLVVKYACNSKERRSGMGNEKKRFTEESHVRARLVVSRKIDQEAAWDDLRPIAWKLGIPERVARRLFERALWSECMARSANRHAH